MPDGDEGTLVPNGASIAAMLSAGIALLTLSVVQVISFVSPGFKDAMLRLGKAWIPNAEGIGPYSGKETVMLAVWLASWLFLDLGLRRRQLDVRTWFGITLLLVAAATILIWPPVWHLFE